MLNWTMGRVAGRVGVARRPSRQRGHPLPGHRVRRALEDHRRRQQLDLDLRRHRHPEHRRGGAAGQRSQRRLGGHGRAPVDLRELFRARDLPVHRRRRHLPGPQRLGHHRARAVVRQQHRHSSHEPQHAAGGRRGLLPSRRHARGRRRVQDHGRRGHLAARAERHGERRHVRPRQPQRRLRGDERRGHLQVHRRRRHLGWRPAPPSPARASGWPWPPATRRACTRSRRARSSTGRPTAPRAGRR